METGGSPSHSTTYQQRIHQIIHILAALVLDKDTLDDEAVDVDQYKGQPAGKSAGLCIKEKSKLQDIVKSNEMNMTRVVQERIAILRALETKPVTFTTETDLKYTQ